MAEFRTLANRTKLTKAIQTRVADLKEGEKVLAAELVLLGGTYGFSGKAVTELLEAMSDLGYIDLGYRDGRLYSLVKKEETKNIQSTPNTSYRNDGGSK